MKAFFVISFLLLVGCATKPVASKDSFAAVIDFQAYFSNSHVVLYVNEKKEFEGDLTSIAIWGHAGERLTLEVTEPVIKLRVRVDNVEGEHALDLRNGSHIGVRYDWRNSRTEVIQQSNDFFYD